MQITKSVMYIIATTVIAGLNFDYMYFDNFYTSREMKHIIQSINARCVLFRLAKEYITILKLGDEFVESNKFYITCQVFDSPEFKCFNKLNNGMWIRIPYFSSENIYVVKCKEQNSLFFCVVREDIHRYIFAEIKNVRKIYDDDISVVHVFDDIKHKK